ncbi:formate transporter [Pelomyxa schiedti]|nr:formate transporter [Pelomyxa schiedti]
MSKPATPAPAPSAAALVEIQSAFMPPAAIIKAIESIGIYKARQNYLRMFVLAFMAGVFVSIGGMTSITFGKGMPNSDPGAQKFAYGAVFPVGLLLVIGCGSELITGNFAAMIPGFYNRKLKWYEILIAWFIVYCGNFVGSIAMAYFLAYQTGLFIKDPWLSGVQGIAEAKVSMRFGQTFLSAMGCNFLVCLTIFMVTASKTMVCKVFVIWFPIMAFATIGFEHCVANMFLIPCGMLYGGNVSFGQFISLNQHSQLNTYLINNIDNVLFTQPPCVRQFPPLHTPK